MDPVFNPFVPGAGTPPPELSGRAGVLAKAELALKRVRIGRPAKSLILVGLRGVGKTVLLVRIRAIAEEAGYRAVLVEAQEGRSLAALIVPVLRQVLFSLDALSGAKEKARRGLRVLRSFVSGLKVTVGDVDIGLSIDPERGVGDSGNLGLDLGELFLAVGEAAKAGDTAVALLVDELQYLSEAEFGALIMALHRVAQENLPLVLIGAGLPQIQGLAGESKSYAERLFDFQPIGALADADARAALQGPAEAEGARFDDAALDEILRVTEGYPYYLQQWGYEAWNAATSSPITRADVDKATLSAVRALDESFFRVRLDRCTPAEQNYLRALAALGRGPHGSGEVAAHLKTSVTTVAPVRQKLIQKGMIFSPRHGQTEFTVPLFDDFMKRAIP
ncbi:AAA family ATPase [Kaistia algarum]|uniref:AAA family ATPase n=1 Tax=Kaistia algarum TaxID=2083279 RepID=UPI000CE752CB|nr:ATP-binding protein [Kaistia algarum]MCX5513386.1 ATP-binding protein [Kaistia algarum]PPE81165.1 AAA family ATPase [Kaistia algarum]